MFRLRLAKDLLLLLPESVEMGRLTDMPPKAVRGEAVLSLTRHCLVMSFGVR